MGASLINIPGEDLGAWLAQKAWPRWLADGIDHKRQSFFETLALDGSGCTADYRRLRVTARQIFVFSKAHAAGLAGAEDAVTMGLDFLDTHAAHAEGGYAWRFDLNHQIIDATRDLYDHAFVLLALASATSVLPKEALQPKAEALVAWIEDKFKHPNGGYLESLPPTLPRRQNPHMHLLEALLAAHEAFGGTSFITPAHGLIELFHDRLFDHDSGALPEFFDDHWTPARKDGVFLVEPGHHCEWVWLLHWYQRLTAPDTRLAEISAGLMGFVDRYGVHAHGHLADALGSDGSVAAASARLWPQTEWLRAEHLRADPDQTRQAAAAASLSSLLRNDGLWHERRAADGALSEDAAPASSLYHLTGAILSVS